MLKIYRNLRPIDWLLIVVIVGFTIGQVWCTMSIVDYLQNCINAITNAMQTGSVSEIWYNGGIMLAFAVGCALFQVGCTFVAAYVAGDMSARIRTKLFNKVESFSIAEVNKFSTASLITRSTNDVQQVQMANVMILRMLIAAPVTIIWAICKISETNAQLTWATVIAIVVLIVILVTVIMVALPKTRIMQKLTDRLNSVTRENLTGIRVVRAYNAEEYQNKKFDKANNDFTKTQIFTNVVLGLLSPVIMLIMNGVSLAIYIIGGNLMNAGEIDYATVTSFMMLASQVIMSFMMLLMMFVMLPRAQVAARRINVVMDTPATIHDPETETQPTEEGTVEFRDVCFRYPDADNDAIKNVSFRIEKGQTLAFIGATGSGKSTLINLIPRFYDVTEGQVLVDGVDVRNMKQKTIHEKIGFVPQKGILFSGTVAENIGYAGITDMDAITHAARIAEADGFINEMTGAYESEIAQGGSNVSGGQKQRLCIARAICAKPEIAIFDDSFSALDFKTDKQVRENLKEELK
ncbi:MAG: ABC transporter ATP-binding protein/permease, partial [Clostridia bacterium]|nr:ABC transporter ATP-binding protein/permease [Clostridia bacterium]